MALGGGGAKGLAHIGVLEVLEENGITPVCVTGTSIGSIVGAVYCLRGSARGLKETARGMIESKEFKELRLDRFHKSDDGILARFKKEVFEKFFFGSLFFRQSHLKIEAATKFFDNLFNGKNFDDCRIKFACNALDIETGEEKVFRSGPLNIAVRASCAIPGVFPPYKKENEILVDGGFTANVPIDILRTMGARIAIASYLGDLPSFKGEPDTGYRISQRTQSFVKYRLDQKLLQQADLIIKPAVSDYHWADFSALDLLVEEGRKAATLNLGRLKRYKSFWSRLFKRGLFNP
jgi:NTE family protein